MRELERTESWQKPTNELTTEQQEQPEANLDLSQNQKQQLQITQELTLDQPITEQIEDDLTQLRNKKNRTPLVFYLRVGAGFLVSFNKTEVGSFIGRFLGFAAFILAAQIFVQLMAKVSQEVKSVLICLCALQISSFLLLFFLDPGTLCEDQPQKINQERLYCQTCRLYKTPKSHHCKYCLKCVKGYDHHCGFFGKCIGRRNYLLFCIFMLSSGFNGAGSMASLMYTAFRHIFPSH